MEQGALRTPNLSSFARLTGHLKLLLDGETAYRDCGNVLMNQLNYSPEKIDIDIAVDGDVVQASEESTRVKPVWEVKGNQFHSAILDLILLGTKNADVNQASGSAATTTITAQLGRAFDIGARNITVTSVKVSTTPFVDGVDFFLEANKGFIRFPEVAAGIAAGDTVVVTYDKPAITRDSITALNKLNRTCSAKLFQMDNKSAIPRFEWSFQATLTADAMTAGADPAKPSDWTFKLASGTAAIGVLGRKTST